MIVMHASHASGYPQKHHTNFLAETKSKFFTEHGGDEKTTGVIPIIIIIVMDWTVH
jgi:hypothetical protein